MVTKKKKQSTAKKRGKTKVSDLKLNKETVKELTDSQTRGVKGGVGLVGGVVRPGLRGGLRRQGDSVDLCDTTEQGCVSLGCMTRISSVGNGCCS